MYLHVCITVCSDIIKSDNTVQNVVFTFFMLEKKYHNSNVHNT